MYLDIVYCLVVLVKMQKMCTWFCMKLNLVGEKPSSIQTIEICLYMYLSVFYFLCCIRMSLIRNFGYNFCYLSKECYRNHLPFKKSSILNKT